MDNHQKTLFPFLKNNTLNPIKSIFDLEDNFFFDEKEEPLPFLNFLTLKQKTQTKFHDDSILKDKYK